MQVARDVQAWLVPHSPVDADSQKRNPLAPRVHRGFFASWHHNGLNRRVLAHVRDLVASCKTAQLADLRVIVTGVPPPPVATLHCWLCSKSWRQIRTWPWARRHQCCTDDRSTFSMCAGHSLGGALATLAAHDLQAEFRFPNLHCYTFGAPRTGNHAFAAESSRLVSETWHIINDRALLSPDHPDRWHADHRLPLADTLMLCPAEDTVTRFGKFWFAYKR